MKDEVKDRAKLGDRLSFALISGLGWLLARTQPLGPKLLCETLGWIAWNFTSRRTVILRNLHHAFPDRPEAWRQRIGRKSITRMLEMFLFPLAMPHMSEATLRKQIRFTPGTTDQLDRIADQRGFILQTPHSTMTESLVLLPMLHRELPHIVTLYRPLDFAPADAYVKQARERFGMELVSRREGLLRARDNLKQGAAAGILFDQNAGKIGALVLFFGRVCSATDLPGILLSKTKTENILLFPRRRGFWSADIEAYPLGVPEDTATATVKAHWKLQRLLEANDDACADWLWGHQRWKIRNRPSERLSLQHKNDYLEKALEMEGLPELPRRTFFAFRLPEEPDLAKIAVEWIPAIRRGRPDVHLTIIAPRECGDELHPLADKLVLFDEEHQLPKLLKPLRELYLDAYFCLTPGTAGVAEAKFCRAGQTLGMLLGDETGRGYDGAYRWQGETMDVESYPKALKGYFEEFGLEIEDEGVSSSRRAKRP